MHIVTSIVVDNINGFIVILNGCGLLASSN